MKKLKSYIDSLIPIIYIKHFDFHYIDNLIKNLNYNCKIIEFNNGFGEVDFLSKKIISNLDLKEFLLENSKKNFEEKTFIILKNISEYLENTKILSIISFLSEKILYQENFNLTIFFIENDLKIPSKLENYVKTFEVKNPNNKEILNILSEFQSFFDIKIDENLKTKIANLFLGLNFIQIRKILYLHFNSCGNIDFEISKLILEEKNMLIKNFSNFIKINDCYSEIPYFSFFVNLKVIFSS